VEITQVAREESDIFVRHAFCRAIKINSYCIHNDEDKSLKLCVRKDEEEISLTVLWCPFCGFTYGK
jgi:hypothetical protein